jgi:hypothetical protein
MIEGFPGRSRESSWPAPALCDLDRNESAEILYIDYSGVATLFDWQQGSYTDEGWHMYQANPHRNGFYNTSGSGISLDIRISDKPHTAAVGSSDNGNFAVFTEIEIEGVRQIHNESSSLSVEPVESAALSEKKTVEVSAFLHGRLLGTTLINLENGSYTVGIPLRYRIASTADITVVVDPFNEHIESDETNNTATAEEILLPETETEITIPTPSQSLGISIQLPEPLPEGLRVTVYSLDGRVVLSTETEPLQSGTTNLTPAGESVHPLPNGMYTVILEGAGFETTRRKIVILTR